MKRKNRLPMLFFCLLIMISCGARQTTVFRKFDSSQSESVAIDAKQRVIMVSQKDGSTRFCAEPSPDALAAIGSSLAASGNYKEIEASLRAAIAESARSFGVRNATIQLLRDGLYRLCEAHLNDAIDPREYKRMANKYEEIMVTLLAIEKLTSIAKPNQSQNIVLNTKASVENGNPENSAPDTEAEATGPTVVDVNVPVLSDTSIETISVTVQSLIQMMYDYWKIAYIGYKQPQQE